MPRYSASRNQYVPSAPGGDSATVYTADGAIAVGDGVAAIAKAAALAVMTLAAPAAGDDGMLLRIVGRTAFAHTVTITAGLGGKGAGFTVLTFGAVGDNIELLADNGKWIPTAAPYGVAVS